MADSEPLIPKHGGYRKLKSFQLAQLIYDVTVRFCERYIDRRSRTHDQMVQAARSGVQNIAEGSQASGTSKKTELKLTNVARSSLEELRLDYQDFLRQRGLQEWPPGHPALVWFKAKRCATLEQVQSWVAQERQLARTSKSLHGQPRTVTDNEAQVRPCVVRRVRVRPCRFRALGGQCRLSLLNLYCRLLDRQLDSAGEPFENEAVSQRLYRCAARGGGHPDRPRGTIHLDLAVGGDYPDTQCIAHWRRCGLE
jgi:four helix bundle protein